MNSYFRMQYTFQCGTYFGVARSLYPIKLLNGLSWKGLQLKARCTSISDFISGQFSGLEPTLSGKATDGKPV